MENMNKQEMIKEQILRFVEEKIYCSKDDIITAIDAPKKQLEEALRDLEKDYDLQVTRHGKYALAQTMGYFKGQFDSKNGGFGFLRMENGMDDIYIGKEHRRGALHGDRVLVKTRKNHKPGRSLEGEVVSILSPVEIDIVGTTQRSKTALFVLADDRRMGDIYIERQKTKALPSGKKVIVRITKRATSRSNPEGKIVEVLGDARGAGVDILACARRFGLTSEFSQEVLFEAKKHKKPVKSKGRKDLRGEVVVTIDGDDAKDLDDAVSLKKLENGNWQLGVHIADVSYYVKEGGELDREALRRGTSVYLIDRVIPMLPKALSNDLCSLNPHEPKYTLSCVMEIDKKGKVVDHDLFNSLIATSHRLTYRKVNEVLEGEHETRTELAEIVPLLEEMNELASVLRKSRFKKGSIDFDMDEAQVFLDEHGKAVDIRLRERKQAEKLIEEFMLCCNITVAEHFYHMELPFLYRIHEQPDAEKMKELAIFLSNFGIKMKNTEDIHPKEIQKVLNKVENTPEAGIVNNVTLRSLKKAKYDATPGQHFGLAAQEYCHFTSPIRRYPDLMIHRIIKLVIEKKMTTKKLKKLEQQLPEIARQASERERNAIEAERAVDDMKMAEYMSSQIGREFDGIVSGVTGFGIFVKLKNTVEGMIALAQLHDDYYEYVEKQYCVIGKRTKNKIALGDKVRIVVNSAQAATGEIEFAFV